MTSIEIPAGWTPERFETAKTLWLEGKSANEIRLVLGGVSRNGVIGKLHRAGLTDGARPQRRSCQSHLNQHKPRAPHVKRDRSNPLGPHSPSEIKRRAIEVRTFELPPEQEPDGPVVPLLALQSHHCRWPIGNPSDPNFGFCGKRSDEGQTYCPSCIKRRKPYLPTPPLNKFNPDAPRARRSA